MRTIDRWRAAAFAIVCLSAPLSLWPVEVFAAERRAGVPGAISGNYAAQYERSILQGVKLDDVSRSTTS